jgi:hypothetical protein
MISEIQNLTENIKLLRASSVAYTKAKNGEIKVTYFLLFLSIAYPIAYLLIKEENVKLVLFGCSFGVIVLIQIFSDKFKGNTSKGAIFKEEFDTIVFDLRWKSTFKKPDRREVLHLSQQYKGDEIKDWYSPNLSPTIEHDIAVAILQHSNTSWDIELRKSYRRWLTNFLIGYSSILFLCFVLLKTDALTIFLLLFSLLSFFTHFITLIRGHTGAIEKRENISKHLDEIIRNKKYIGTTELRDVQDEIFMTRQEAAKVPNFFFRWYKKQLNIEAEEYIEEVNKLYNSK